MAAVCLTTLTEQWIRHRLQLKHPHLADVRTLSIPGTCEEKIRHLGSALIYFVRLKSLDLSYNALVSLEGITHLNRLEKLILYHNLIPSLEEVKVLFELPVLKELDLRLNPLTKYCPHYRLYLVSTMPSLKKLDNLSITNRERKAVNQQFSDLSPSHLSSSLNLPQDQSNITLNAMKRNSGDQNKTTTGSIHKKVEELNFEGSQDFIEQKSTTLNQELAKSILRCPAKNYSKCKESQLTEQPPSKSFTSPQVTERPKVWFGPVFDKHRTVPEQQNPEEVTKPTRHKARVYFTPNSDQSQGSWFTDIQPSSPPRSGLNLSDPSNLLPHPVRLTYSSFKKTGGGSNLQPQVEKKKKGRYRKPLEMLLNLVDKHWRGERSLHQNNGFLSQAVQILSMMESDISSREAEVRSLKQDINLLHRQEEEHKTEVFNISAQLEEARKEVGKLNEQLRIVLEENVALQKQLIKLERQYLRSMMKSSPITQIREAQTEVEQLKREIEALRKKVQEAEKVQELSDRSAMHPSALYTAVE